MSGVSSGGKNPVIAVVAGESRCSLQSTFLTVDGVSFYELISSIVGVLILATLLSGLKETDLLSS